MKRYEGGGAAGGVVFTITQKFAETPREDAETPRRRDALPKESRSSPRPGALALNPDGERAHVVVTADEAHRGRYGFVEGGARRMRAPRPHGSRKHKPCLSDP